MESAVSLGTGLGAAFCGKSDSACSLFGISSLSIYRYILLFEKLKGLFVVRPKYSVKCILLRNLLTHRNPTRCTSIAARGVGLEILWAHKKGRVWAWV